METVPDYAASLHSSPEDETGKDEMNDYSDEETRSFVYEEKNVAEDENCSSLGEEEEEEEKEEEDIESEHEEQDEAVLEDMRKLQNNYKLRGRFRLINRVGEGTFSTVYKAEDLTKDRGDWAEYLFEPLTPPKKPRAKTKRYVALKKIYVTSSPSRILNELQILYDLRGDPSVCHIKAAFRLDDQVIAVLPYFPHTDFRLMFRTFLVEDMRHYFKSLLGGLAFVHSREVIHRDIKPTNFLYNPKLRRGVLVDFGLAEYESDGIGCLCKDPRMSYTPKIEKIMEAAQGGPSQAPAGYPRNDSRPSRRANRAGTRGFRAPEVLFKCPCQSTKIDVWSVGVILLTFMARRFPFFHSLDDADALIEIACIFGYRRMQRAAAEHGLVFDTNIPSIGEKGYTLARIILWSSCLNELTGREKQAIRLLNHLLDLSPKTRYTAAQALQHSFFQNPQGDDLPWGADDPAQMAPADEANDETACDAGDDVKLI
ncbi:Cell division control protein 7 [Microsporum ferrugineum]